MTEQDQWKLAIKALNILSKDIDVTFAEGPHEEAEIDLEKKVPPVRIKAKRSIAIRAEAVKDAVEFLTNLTGKSKPIDPFTQPDGNAWTIVSSVLAALMVNDWSYYFALAYLDECYKLQVRHKTRIHKGSPHFWISLRALGLGNDEEARIQMILAFVEDSIDFNTPLKAPAAQWLLIKLGVSNKGLEALGNHILKQKNANASMPLFAEELLLDFILTRVSKSSAVSGISALRIPFNRHLVSTWCKAIESASGGTGKSLEFLVAYLFQSVDGLQLMKRKHGRAGEIDIFIRNLAGLGRPLPWMEQFVLVECKNTVKPVSTKEMAHFIAKLSLPRIENGIIVSKRGLTGAGNRANAEGLRDHIYSRSGIVIIDVTVKELSRVGSPTELLQLLQSKYEKSRLGIALSV